MSQIATVPGHICNMLCSEEAHVDLAWAEPEATKRDVEYNWSYRYGVEIVMVRQVEGRPPGDMPEGESIVKVSGRKPMSDWPGCATWGVWWREAEITEPPSTRWQVRARYPGVCKRTGRIFTKGTPIERHSGGWAIAEGS